MYCFFAISLIESFSPKPTSKRPIQPPMPTTVIISLFLYLARFLTVAFPVKLSLFHVKPILSKNTLLPELGGRGRISEAGFSRSCESADIKVAATVLIIAAIRARNACL